MIREALYIALQCLLPKEARIGSPLNFKEGSMRQEAWIEICAFVLSLKVRE